MDAPTPEQVRAALADLDARRRRIVAGLLTAMMRDPGRVRDREWVSEQLAQVTLLSGEIEADSAADAIEDVRAYLQDHASDLLAATYLLFQRVALDLQPRAAAGFELEEALAVALSYLPAPEDA